MPLAFFALALESELQYRRLYTRINSGDDGATSLKNLVNFRLVTAEMARLICACTYVPVHGEKRRLHLSFVRRAGVPQFKALELVRPASIILPRSVHFCTLGVGPLGTLVISNCVCFISIR